MSKRKEKTSSGDILRVCVVYCKFPVAVRCKLLGHCFLNNDRVTCTEPQLETCNKQQRHAECHRWGLCCHASAGSFMAVS
jgi:hypothetical protein